MAAETGMSVEKACDMLDRNRSQVDNKIWRLGLKFANHESPETEMKRQPPHVIEEIAMHAGDGKSAKEIAKLMDLSRNAVIGLAWRHDIKLKGGKGGRPVRKKKNLDERRQL